MSKLLRFFIKIPVPHSIAQPFPLQHELFDAGCLGVLEVCKASTVVKVRPIIHELLQTVDVPVITQSLERGAFAGANRLSITRVIFCDVAQRLPAVEASAEDIPLDRCQVLNHGCGKRFM